MKMLAVWWMQDIRGGARLKKVVTNDRSAPVTGAARKTSPTEPNGSGFRNPNGGSAAGSPAGGEPPRLPGIGGLFAGGFPQLKKAGERGDPIPGRRPAAPNSGRARFISLTLPHLNRDGIESELSVPWMPR